MPDRSPRRHTLLPQYLPGGVRGALLLRERPGSPPDAPQGSQGSQGSQDDNPFAPPPEGTPDRPWQPRHPSGGQGDQGDQGGQGGQEPQTPPGGYTPWGSQWSDQQPGRAPGGGFGERPGAGPEGNGQNGQGGPGGQGGGQGGPASRWDPTDPAQRKARYALLCGMWAFFFALFGWPYVALLLGALALNWGIVALRAKPRTPDPDAPAPAADPKGKPQTTAAVSGLVTASLALALVAATFTAQLVYQDYYTCTKDALTNEAEQACGDLLPKELKGILGANT
ncbi:hypothetical protein [Streptomyces sp. Amel2xC10]|uniref:hypothetical protein n=1 Tax=Streptomyces sp. Amel2xC10 TaxID=1305826 RepID=UPI000A08E0FE|nr:hypothetical protein [Streptomyces sp. Amel2xC10]SMF14901.1 hypothetical protein SAMN02745830_01848 [Streptomyces sp. Amel2xC10]